MVRCTDTYQLLLLKWIYQNRKKVKHQARRFGYTKFGTNRFFRGFIDLTTLWFMNKFGKRPMHFFGLWGTIMLFIGLITIYLGIDKLYFDTRARLITSRPEFFIALTLMILGSQFYSWFHS